MEIKLKEIITRLEAQANPENAAGMARYGIRPKNCLGIKIPELRKLGKEIGRQHALALELWQTGIHEARILAAYVADPDQVTPELMDQWRADFDSWDICDQVCANLFDRTPYAFDKCTAWVGDAGEYQRRAGFALMACLAWHAKIAPDELFEPFFPLIIAGADDERNYVKKAVNWALRQIGKRRLHLNQRAIATAREIGKLDSPNARWIASDALKELESEKVRSRLA